MPVRQIQAHEVQGHHVREMRRGSDPANGPARTHGAHRTGLAGGAHLVHEIAALPHRPVGGHDAQGPGAGPLFRELRGHRTGADAAEIARTAARGPVSEGGRRVRGRRVFGRHRRRGHPQNARGHRPRGGMRKPARGAQGNQFRGQAQEAGQKVQADRGLRPFRRPARMDDPRSRSGHPAGTAPLGAARRRPLRHVGPERPVPACHQPQQPAEKADRVACARDHRAQRETHAPGIGGRPV